MRIIVPVLETKEEVCPTFGRAPFFALKDTESGALDFIVNTAAEEESGAGIKAAQIVVDGEADVLLTPRLGENSAKLLKAAEIKIYKTEGSDLLENIEAFLSGKRFPLEKFHGGYHGIK